MKVKLFYKLYFGNDPQQFETTNLYEKTIFQKFTKKLWTKNLSWIFLYGPNLINNKFFHFQFNLCVDLNVPR